MTNSMEFTQWTQPDVHTDDGARSEFPIMKDGSESKRVQEKLLGLAKRIEAASDPSKLKGPSPVASLLYAKDRAPFTNDANPEQEWSRAATLSSPALLYATRSFRSARNMKLSASQKLRYRRSFRRRHHSRTSRNLTTRMLVSELHWLLCSVRLFSAVSFLKPMGRKELSTGN
jgi:hypothetical protein